MNMIYLSWVVVEVGVHLYGAVQLQPEHNPLVKEPLDL